MRKTVIALIAVVPLLFMLIIFSSVNMVSLGVNVSANGITVKFDDDITKSVAIDMAERAEHFVSAEVAPNNASEKGYTLTSDNPQVADVDANGKLLVKSEGNATIVATSNDKGFTDSLNVSVYSTQPYGLRFFLNKDGADVLTADADGNYSADLSTGIYGFGAAITPDAFTDYSVEVTKGKADVDFGGKTVLLPFSGEVKLKVSVPDSIGNIERTVSLNVSMPSNCDLTVNGVANTSSVLLDKNSKTVSLYVERRIPGSEPVFTSEYATAVVREKIDSHRYIMDVTVNDSFDGERFVGQIAAGNAVAQVEFGFGDFDFALNSERPITDGKISVLNGVTTKFSAVPVVVADGVTFLWGVDGADRDVISVSADGKTCSVTAKRNSEFTLWAEARRDGELLCERKQITVSVVTRITNIIMPDEFSASHDLAMYYTVAGKVYDGQNKVENKYLLNIRTVGSAGVTEFDADNLNCYISDETLGDIVVEDGKWYFVANGSGKLTLTAEWKGAATFGGNARASVTFYVVHDAVAVSNAPQLVQATAAGDKVVLLNDIMLGTDANGAVLSLQERASMLGRMQSTYNTEWYKQDPKQSIDNAKVSYVMEFKNDVYGNGNTVNAEYFTAAWDSQDKPLIDTYKGPLYFVKYQEIASVAGQDNCAFLMRTDGVKLYGVNLRGCGDDKMSDSDGYNLSYLNLVGTTLEINASVQVINCRISNGRNVVRVYGGNRNGSNYFINGIADNKGCDNERITVVIQGCIIYHGREFLVKVGANRALRAHGVSQAAPQLTDANGNPYPTQGTSVSNNYGKLYDDSYFYSHYVMTDLTIKDSVLETSGLFTIGVESNFAGDLLTTGSEQKYQGSVNENVAKMTSAWQQSGGTSFASVVRLQGDVRLYDWKDIALVDSSTLIESPSDNALGWLKLEVNKMLQHVASQSPYDALLINQDGKQFVHGGIAFYGGGRNYSQLDIDALNPSLGDYMHLNVNIDILKQVSDVNIQHQGDKLPLAAGVYDFNFYMYDRNSANSYSAQQRDIASGTNYGGVVKYEAF